MAATDRSSADGAHDLATRVREASFAHLLVRSDGAALAAAGLLADACVAVGVPYQVSAVLTRAGLAERDDATEGDATIQVGVEANDPSAPAAFEAAEAVGADPDPALALAGVVADGGTPEDAAPELLERSGFERTPGVAAPVADVADALAHSTLAHAPYSGDVEAAEATVAELSADDDRDRRLASLLAIDAVSQDGTTVRSAGAIERAIHPLAGGPLESVEGYADVLDALAATAPGLAVTLAIGGPAAAALDAWRDHARAAHEGVRAAESSRRDGLLVVETDGPVRAVARLVRDFRSPEPAVLAVGDGEAALATADGTAGAIEPAAESAGGSGLAGGDRGYARFDADRTAAFTDAIEEAI